MRDRQAQREDKGTENERQTKRERHKRKQREKKHKGTENERQTNIEKRQSD